MEEIQAPKFIKLVMSCCTVDCLTCQHLRSYKPARSIYINSITQRTRGVFIPKYHQKTRHRLQTSHRCSIYTILHTGHCDRLTYKKAFTVSPQRGLIYRSHRVKIEPRQYSDEADGGTLHLSTSTLQLIVVYMVHESVAGYGDGDLTPHCGVTGLALRLAD